MPCREPMEVLRRRAMRKALWAWLWEQANQALCVPANEGGHPPPVPSLRHELVLDELRELLDLPPLHNPWSIRTVQVPVAALVLWGVFTLAMVAVLVIALIKLFPLGG